MSKQAYVCMIDWLQPIIVLQPVCLFREVIVNTVLREEKKFLLNAAGFRSLDHRLEQCLSQDAHNGVLGYSIRSLYFDTVYDRDYFEKEAGIETRRKIRLRCYDPNADYAMLEMKQKQGVYQKKRSLRIGREQAIRMAAGDYTPLLSFNESFAAECYGLMQTYCYRPTTIVEYRRKAYVAKENKIRVTFDSSIMATESCFDLFCPTLNMNPVLDPSAVVLEVKFNGFLLEYIKRMINSVDRSELSVSKYVLARQQSRLTRL